MPIFEAATIRDLMTPERDAGRVARKARYIVAVEARDGSWCELDGDDEAHARVLADNWTDPQRMGARGASVWAVNADGTLPRRSRYLAVEPTAFDTEDLS
ncbi:MAG: hypothetical protein HXX10_07510 [Rhodoplanes sp.]|uniref:hypothetical protein n=1 Tax=Rhodoplanes sp. TaxID=1968906 RepID=UPI001826B3BB|nr:hypothetical protein [Rhodoplanes sp.]NVO13867.1 hypothetical protein [Rhodoplanes sp.]